ncbi:superfamily II DNA or RNA helicase [Natronocella acetinitrilica]|uniref:Superfamily II DNA or RNA helicase n=1 Tax=Natronocella acetinitrilica TaxID=414046 RepID=A0AAE3KGW7_9GAMM|nr:superfamily II DNA or RNA helicase [Natronocella acetinitrilica]
MDQFGLFDRPEDALADLAGPGWPDVSRFPRNGGGNSVRRLVLDDLNAASRPLIIAGFASLDELIKYIAGIPQACEEVRLLLGSEPYPSRTVHLAPKSQRFKEEVEKYWLERGISLAVSGKVIDAIEKLRSKRVVARYVSGVRLHAKMYCAEKAVTLGSSNFSKAGLQYQLEANARFENGDKRFRGAWQLAERYWEVGEDYSAELIALLERLLRFVEWPEAVARACAELLEGDWAKDYMQHQQLGAAPALWPSQKQGIAQALWLLDTVGSALVADATGAGKTRMGAHLVRAQLDRIWSSGRIRKGNPMLICPPAVQKAWHDEATLCGLPLSSSSHGVLSNSQSIQREAAIDAVRRAQILAVDEAHNFLNPQSRRTRQLLGNMSDHTILFTATPINRGVRDLLRLVDMLGADNLAPSTLKMFEQVLKRRDVGDSVAPNEAQALRAEIQRFTVRRTKSLLNRMVDEAPQEYRDADGRQCRYPRHESRMYELGEPDNDCQLAEKIRALANKLRGLAYLAKPIQMPEALRSQWSEEEYLKIRLNAASKLPAYLVMATLRSSRAALLEHLRGTQWAEDVTRITGLKKQPSGNVRRQLMELAGNPPKNRLSTPLPAWLTDPGAHRQACREEEAIYIEIGKLALQMTERREEAKADHLCAVLKRHSLVLAFDSRPITLYLMREKLRRRGVEVLLATGSDQQGKRSVNEAFRRDSKHRNTIALCSDSMSEGINLQRASCIVHLDMPSVVRVAEQRVGRVDRMDSPHKNIQAWWPKDAKAFALRTDDRFIERYQTVETLLGSNLPLPEDMRSAKEDSAVVDPLTLAQELEQEGRERGWDGLEDAFTPVRALVSGETALVEPAVYAEYRKVTARVLSRVSLVRTDRPWAFFCLRGAAESAPKWIAFPRPDSAAMTELGDVCELLRARLGPDVQSGQPDETAMVQLEEFLKQLLASERLLLPRRKQRALEQMAVVIKRYRDDAAKAQDENAYNFFQRLVEMLENPDPEQTPDWNDLAERWLDVIRPLWFTFLTQRRRRRPLLLNELTTSLKGTERIPMGQLQEAFQGLRIGSPLDERIAACVLGVRG